MKLRVVLFFYNLLFLPALLVLLPGYFIGMRRRGNYRRHFGQRFGIFRRDLRERLAVGGWTWIHAVSVGEVLIALKLVGRLRALDPTIRIVLSTTTSTGYALAAKQAADWFQPIYHPLDFPPFIGAALRLIRPARLVLVEAEVWPNFVRGARRLGAAVALVNARLSPRSERRYRRFRPLVAPLFRLLDHVCVQDATDVPRLAGIGVPPDRLRVVGSIKFDGADSDGNPARQAELRRLLAGLGVARDAPVLLGGSTFPGEERLLAEVYGALRPAIPGLFLIVVPRHVERADEVMADLAAAGLRAVRRTRAVGGADRPGATAAANDAAGSGAADRPDVLVVDTTGELRDWYRTATAVFVGKSLTAVGGQNPAEPVAAGCPVVFGPHMENFAAAVALLLGARGAIQVAAASELAPTFRTLLRDPAAGRDMARRGAAALAVHRGATGRTAAVVLGGLGGHDSACARQIPAR